MCCVVAAGHGVQRYVVMVNGCIDSGKLVSLLKRCRGMLCCCMGALTVASLFVCLKRCRVCCVAELRS